ncbi:MAG TPA: BF3164 family lipoprotein [Gemmatimonadales bacterium]
MKARIVRLTARVFSIRRSFAIAVAALLATAACRDHDTSWKLDQLADGTQAISHAQLHPLLPKERVLVADPGIGEPRHLIVDGPRLWIADHSGDPYLHVIDIPTGKVLRSVGPQGEGPGDFQQTPQFSRRPGDTTGIWAYDDGLRRLTAESAEPHTHPATFNAPPEFVDVYSYLWLGRNRLAGIGDMDTNRIIFADTTGHLQAMVKADLLGPDSVPLLARRAASGAFAACADPVAQRFAVLYQIGGRIDIFDSTGRLASRAKVPFANNGEWAPTARDHTLWAQVHWFFYIDCNATPKYLYALFDGHRIDGPHGGRVRAGRYVHVFDWNGNLVKVVALGHEMSAIAVSGDTLLFAAGQQGEGIFEYDITGLHDK